MPNAYLVDRMGYNQESTIGERILQNVFIFIVLNNATFILTSLSNIGRWSMVDGVDVNLCMRLPNVRSDNNQK